MINKPSLQVIKIGGNVVEQENTLQHFLDDFAKLTEPKILIHGGGKIATLMAKKLNIPTKMIDGRRVTNAESLDLITMVYGGLINKKIVCKLQALTCNAIGFSGADANLVKAEKRPEKPIDFGFVGDVSHVDYGYIHQFIQDGLTPVFCGITHNGKGQLLNTNADTMAAAIAAAMTPLYNVSLYYCFEKKGVLKNINDDNSVIPHITPTSYKTLKNKNIITDGMLPKMHNCLWALENGVTRVHIGNTNMIHLSTKATFTTITL